MVIRLSKSDWGRIRFRGAFLALALASAACPVSRAQGATVGYYDMNLGAGNTNQASPITAAGHTAVQLFDLQSSNLSGIDVLFVQNPSSTSYGPEYLSRVSSIASAVAGGMILVLHDRYVTGAASILPEGSAFAAQRDLTSPGSNDINILDATSPVVSGVAGVLSSTSLDGGGFSNLGYVRADTLPAGAKRILWRPDPGDAQSRNRTVTFAYAYGDGAVIYSTIPLDQFLSGFGPNPPRANFAGIYAPNVIHYAALLSGGAPDVSVTISDERSAAVPGTPMTYTIEAQNLGIGAAMGARVRTNLAAALKGVTWACAPAAGATCSASGTGDIDDLVDLPVGAAVTYTVSGTIASSAFGTLQSTATVQAPSGQTDPVAGNNTATDTDALTPEADLSVVKDDGVETAIPGGQVVYTITVTNTGPSDAPGSVVSDAFPPLVTTVAWTCAASAGAQCGVASGTGDLQETIDLPAGSTITYEATAALSPAATGLLVNTASAAAPAGITDPAVGNNSEEDSDTLAPRADLAIAKKTERSVAVPGEPVTYTITVTNTGPSDAAGLSVLDAVPAALETPAWTCAASAGSSCTASGTGDIADAVDLNAGGTLTYTLTGVLAETATGTLTNGASVTVPDGTTDPQPSNNSAEAATPIGLPFDFYTVTPCRLIDTRWPNGLLGGPALASGTPRLFQVTGSCGIPATAKAISANVTVLQPDASGFLQMYPDTVLVPSVSVVNFSAGQVRANNAILGLGPEGRIQALATQAPNGSVHVVVDMTGYFD